MKHFPVNHVHRPKARGGLGCAALWLAPLPLLAGGSGLNVVVVVNQASRDSLALGNYYCERRQVPPQNFLRLDWPGGNVNWTHAQFESVLAAPLQAMLASRGLTNQIESVVLSMDIPYRVTSGDSANSTTSVLFYGFKADTVPPEPWLPMSCSLPPDSTNHYAGREGIFRLSSPGTNGQAVLATFITGVSLDEAKRLVDRGVSSDGSLPTQAVVLEKTTDPARNVRYLAFDNAIFDLRLDGRFPVLRTNSDQTYGLTNLLGLQTGLSILGLSADAFVPGAIADSLTSYGGCLFDNCGQTPLLAFLQAGASGSYGTLTEPCNYLEKFPDPRVYFYQARGFSLAEAYYQSLVSPYQGVIVAEPLAAPFAQPASGRWLGLASNAVLNGTAWLALEFNAADVRHPLQQVDLFLDGVKLETLTNVPPTQGNVLSVTLDGFTTRYVVPAGATLASVAQGLATALNAEAVSNQTQVQAVAHGDRIELQSTDVSRPGAQTALEASCAIGEAPALTTSVAASGPAFLDSVARGWRAFEVRGTAAAGDYLQITITKTNGETVTLSVTNGVSPVGATQLTIQLWNLIAAAPALQGADGVSVEDIYPRGDDKITFLLYARVPGLPAAQVGITLLASTNLLLSPSNTSRLDEKLADVRPRAHLFLTAGVTNLAFAFPLDSTALADGHHELTTVAYEGSHVRTQTRLTQSVRVRNTPLSAMFTTSAAWGVAALDETLHFTVTANTQAVARIELFSTGGSLGVVSNEPAADFSIAATNLGQGLHPFYAMVTDNDGNRYRTESLSVRLSEAPVIAPFRVRLSADPITLFWPAVASHRYEVLSADGVTNEFQLRATVTASQTGPMQWRESQTNAAQRFYRVRGGP